MICKNDKGNISVCKTSRICVVKDKIFLLKKNDSFFLQLFVSQWRNTGPICLDLKMIKGL